MKQALRRLSLVFDQGITIEIAKFVDPVEGSHDVGPESLNRFQVAGSLEIRTRQQDVERRGVDAAIVLAIGHFLEIGHLTVTGFVEDLAGLGIFFPIDDGRLGRRQILEDTPGEVRPDPEALERRDETVAAERRVEPGQARVRVWPGWQAAYQHMQVGDGPVKPGIELSIDRREPALPSLGPAVLDGGFIARLGQGSQRLRIGLPLAADLDRERMLGAG